MATEAELYQTLRKSLPDLDWQRIEVDLGSGVPDCSYTQGMAELKVTDGWKISFRTHQPAWISRRVRRGGRVRIIVRQGGAGRDVLWVLPGRTVLTLEEQGLRGPDVEALGKWPGGPRQWNWDEIRAAMLSEVL